MRNTNCQVSPQKLLGWSSAFCFYKPSQVIHYVCKSLRASNIAFTCIWTNIIWVVYRGVQADRRTPLQEDCRSPPMRFTVQVGEALDTHPRGMVRNLLCEFLQAPYSTCMNGITSMCLCSALPNLEPFGNLRNK